MVGPPVEDDGLTGAAGALLTRTQGPHTGPFESVDDRAPGRHIDLGTVCEFDDEILVGDPGLARRDPGLARDSAAVVGGRSRTRIPRRGGPADTRPRPCRGARLPVIVEVLTDH
ncbi:hypothetical protein EB836_15245 [Brevibacterium sp. S111]|nr:hypothetical protein EB836_15245 [Brevibacterium sp. S111]